MELLKKTSEGRFLLEREGNLSCASIQEIDDYTKRASLAGILAGEELLIISDTLDTVENLKGVISTYEKECPNVYELTNQITNVSYLTYSIRSKLTPNGLVRDEATPTLGPLRKQVRQAYDRVTNTLQRLIEANQLTGVIQDDVISVRNFRRGSVAVQQEVPQKLADPPEFIKIRPRGPSHFLLATCGFG